MLHNASKIHGYAIEASDGRLGTVSDFLFDDAGWLIRWLVVDAGTWLSGRKVLLPPTVLGHVDEKQKDFSVRSTKQEIKDSPDIDADRPVSRQMESRLYDYYGWNPYWSTGLFMGGYGYGYMGGVMDTPSSPESQRREERVFDTQRDDDDPHLRGIAAVTGYHIHALDGEIGHVEDFFVEDADWSIHYLLIDTRNWWPGKKVLISPRSAQTIDWSKKLVNLNVDRARFKASPAYDASMTVDRAYERQFHSYYGGAPPAAPV
jgi:PRC-barrel domain